MKFGICVFYVIGDIKKYSEVIAVLMSLSQQCTISLRISDAFLHNDYLTISQGRTGNYL